MPVAANTLGVFGAVCWSVQLVPQIIINYRRHDTTGLQPTMMLLWACAGVPLGVYNIVQNFNIALRIQPQILTFLSLLTWMQCKHYGENWQLMKTISVAAPIAAVMGGIECGLIFALRHARHDHIHWPITFMATLSACFLCAGVLRHYWDIYKERTVRGISFIFIGIDAMGDLTSLISVLFQPSLDVLGMVIYGSELSLWLGVFACGGYCKRSHTPSSDLEFADLCVLTVNLRPWLQQRRERTMSGQQRAYGRSESLHGPEPNLSRHSSASSSVFRTASTGCVGDGASPASVRLRVVTSDPDVPLAGRSCLTSSYS